MAQKLLTSFNINEEISPSLPRGTNVLLKQTLSKEDKDFMDYIKYSSNPYAKNGAHCTVLTCGVSKYSYLLDSDTGEFINESCSKEEWCFVRLDDGFEDDDSG